MNRRTVKTIVIAASVVGLSGATAATAWADTFTPGIEEPTADLGLPGGNGNDLMGSTPLGGGSKSSAAGTNGKTYGSGYGSNYGSNYDDELMYGSADDRSDNGYWRSGSSRSHSGSDSDSDY
ncbi:MAG TPA: hypothetical protein VL595_21715 [Pseudonocardia sp.]|jgi:hypothetical protein|nr:hypothetical protein [Pseudonocardia sp.]